MAGFSSPTYWRLVSEGKSNLSRVSMNRMISAMGLAGFDADYFKALVNFCNAKGDDAKMPYWKEMRQIAKTCCNEISAADVSKSLEFLTKAGFLKKGADGSYCQTEKNVTASKEGLAYAVHSMQRQMLRLASESIERFEPQDRSVSSVTLTVNRECYERIAQEIDAFRKKIVAMASETEDADQIYHLNMQLFPMTWKLKKDEEA
ncbi:TIGR02147 family protein [Fibrobacter succinogenes]|uniref:TIGR02147 family protein n=1 Tax=Fibrobacter succinogenes TaxID=833 RepID=UPI0026EF4070|nr:TIGR02147 family protein [Fibrobacter succinogenes]